MAIFHCCSANLTFPHLISLFASSLLCLLAPSGVPSSKPSVHPTGEPSTAPSVSPSMEPTSCELACSYASLLFPFFVINLSQLTNPLSYLHLFSLSAPSNTPTSSPSANPSGEPSRMPSSLPTLNPTHCELHDCNYESLLIVSHYIS